MKRAVFAAAIAMSAALLFLVQPMVARLLLPIVGGSTLVWSAALVFFQAALLAGYALAYVVSRLPLQRGIFVVALGAAGLASLPFVAPSSIPDWSAPGSWVLAQLAAMIAAPFVVMAATSPLLQRWYSRTDAPDADEPYRLYAASNAGSIVGLLSYPFLIEPLSSLSAQATGWAVGFAVLVVLVGAAAVKTPVFSAKRETPQSKAPDQLSKLWWIVCAAIPASLLVTMTASITADIAPVPLLWVVPLAVYLGSHVWVFSQHAPAHGKAESALVLAVVPYAALVAFDLSKPWWFFAVLAVVMLAIIALAYHGELVRTRPSAQHLTTFYLCTALGGVLGGAFATFGGPMLFDTLFELKLELVAAALLLPAVRETVTSRRLLVASLAVIALVAAAAAVGEANIALMLIPATCALVAVGAYAFDRRAGLVVLIAIAIGSTFIGDPITRERSPYGRYRINKIQNELGVFHELVVGRVSHGVQARDESLRALPLSYYHPAGPIGQVMRDEVGNGQVAVIGLGAGAAAAYATDQRHVTFFEIDPLVVKLARNPKFFTHLAACGDHCSVEVGDGRLRVGELKDSSVAVLVLDAFSGDAIPTHLLTVEAFELYKRKLEPDGVLLINGSNMYVDIGAVVADTGARTGMDSVQQEFWPREAHMEKLQVSASDWTLLSPDKAVIERFANDPRWKRPSEVHPDRAWTDDWQNLFAHYDWQ